MNAAVDNGIRAGISPYTAAFVIGIAAFMEVLDLSIANVSLQHIAGSMAAGQDEATWVLTAYMVSNAIVIPVTGWLSTLLGRKTFYVASIAMFSLSSLFCGLAASLPMLLAFRFIQGLGGGALQPVSQSILTDAFPPAKRSMAFSIYGMAVLSGPAIGPTLGGFITDHFSWRWIFLINVPIGFLLLGVVQYVIHDPAAIVAAREKQQKSNFRIDYIGLALLAVGLSTLQIVFDKGQEDDWFSSHFILTMGVISAVALSGLILWEWGHEHPIIELRLLKNRNFAIGMVFLAVAGFASLVTAILLPEFAQTLLGYTAIDAGLVLSPGSIAIVLLLPVAAWMLGHVDPRWMIAAGLVVAAAAMLHMTTMELSVDYGTLMFARILQTICMPLIFVPTNTIAYVGIAREDFGNASALINLSRNLGSSLGTSLVTTWLARSTQRHLSDLSANVTPLNPAYQQSLSTLSPHLGGVEGAQGFMAQMVGRQASMLAFIDDYRYIAIALILCAPLAFLMKKGVGLTAEVAH